MYKRLVSLSKGTKQNPAGPPRYESKLLTIATTDSETHSDAQS